MQVAIKPPFAWFDLNEEAELAYGFRGTEVRVKIYASLGLALVDAVRGVIRQLPHKKHLLYLQARVPLIDQVVALMANEGCTLQPLNLEDLEAADSSLISADTCLVVFAEDDPLLGKLFATEKIEKLLNERKILGLKISHHHHRYMPVSQVPTRHVAQLRNLGSDLGALVHHERWRWPSLLGEVQNFAESVIRSLKSLAKQGFIQPSGISKFENAKTAQWDVFFKGGETEQRIWDRAVIYWRDMNAQAVREILLRKLREESGAANGPAEVETTSLSRWRGVRTMDWLKNYGFDDEMIRGTLILDQNLANVKVADWLVEIRQQILNAQTGM